MLTRVTLTLDSADVDLLDRLATHQGLNRSEQMRQLLGQSRAMIRQTVEVLEAAERQRDDLLETVSSAEIAGLQELLPEMQNVQGAILGAMARLEGSMAAHEAAEGHSEDVEDVLSKALGNGKRRPATPKPDPRPSNHGGHKPESESEGTTQ